MIVFASCLLNDPTICASNLLYHLLMVLREDERLHVPTTTSLQRRNVNAPPITIKHLTVKRRLEVLC